MIWTDPRVYREDIGLLLGEDSRQVDKWGIQVRSPFEWLTYTTEELGELAKAISEHVYRDAPCSEVFKEAIQVATLALKIAKMSFAKENT